MSRLEEIRGTIINIQHYNYEDGPGVRTTVFLKGCPLRCRWCGNPESISVHRDLAFDPKDCIGADKCGLCLKVAGACGLITRVDAAPQSEIKKDPGIRIHREALTNDEAAQAADEAVELCPGKALFYYGKEVAAREVIDEADRDMMYYGSEGGLTISGGEPLLQPEFTAALSQLAHAHGYTAAIESAGNVPWSSFETVIPHLDIVLHDIKTADSEKHRLWTGSGSERILANWRRAYEMWPDRKFIVRTPVIPGVNDTREEIERILEFILPYENVVQYELLPYHRLGLGKYEILGRPYTVPDSVKTPPEEKMRELRDLIEEAFSGRGVREGAREA